LKKHHLIIVLYTALLLTLIIPKFTAHPWLNKTQANNKLPIIPNTAPEKPINFSSEHVIYRVNNTEKLVAITVDDGPNPKFTPRLLDILRENKIHATFFVVGNQLEKYPDLGKRILKEGNEVGNHTYTHPKLLKNNSSEIIDEIVKCNDTIEKVLGIKTKYFRPPKGQLNHDIIKAAHEHGEKVVLWSIALEHHDANTPEEMVNRIVNNITPGGIILMHDGRLDRTKSIQAVPELIKELQDNGYKFVTLSELLESNKTI
jgi:peptidoglycan/xylan/chitin deacetylase (PgdA/CDA1 family)